MASLSPSAPASEVVFFSAVVGAVFLFVVGPVFLFVVVFRFFACFFFLCFSLQLLRVVVDDVDVFESAPGQQGAEPE